MALMIGDSLKTMENDILGYQIHLKHKKWNRMNPWGPIGPWGPMGPWEPRPLGPGPSRILIFILIFSLDDLNNNYQEIPFRKHHRFWCQLASMSSQILPESFQKTTPTCIRRLIDFGFNCFLSILDGFLKPIGNRHGYTFFQTGLLVVLAPFCA